MIYHVYSHYTPKNPDTARRMHVAKLTWASQPWHELPVPDNNGRLFVDRGGKVPYIKDILDKGAHNRHAQDILVFTNSDICVRSNCAMLIAAAMQALSAAYCFRRDFGRLNGPVPDKLIHKGNPYVGSDLYAMRVGWWKRYRSDFPDMLLGRECWDAVLRLLIDQQTDPSQSATLHNLIYHEWHASTWENPRNRGSLPSQLHNQGIARAWMRAWGYDPRSIGI
jgi:hypothetical protein